MPAWICENSQISGALKRSTVYYARYDRPDRYMRSSRSEGFDNPKRGKFKKRKVEQIKKFKRLIDRKYS